MLSRANRSDGNDGNNIDNITDTPTFQEVIPGFIPTACWVPLVAETVPVEDPENVTTNDSS
jgi:hypothetical protein